MKRIIVEVDDGFTVSECLDSVSFSNVQRFYQDPSSEKLTREELRIAFLNTYPPSLDEIHAQVMAEKNQDVIFEDQSIVDAIREIQSGTKKGH